MRYNPHKYQTYATEFIETNPVSALLLQMGLGKTSIALTAINDLMFDSFDVHKVLVVAPIRVGLISWPDEIKKWDHLKDLRFSVAIGTLKERMEALKKKADVYIINRENVDWLFEKSGVSFDFDMLVIDELSSFKNGKSKRFKALLKARPKVKRIVGLTGTPASNGLMDLWAEFRLLDMGKRLGKFITGYREAYFLPDKRNGEIIYSYKPQPWAEKEIYNKISDITVSMKATDYLDMPELISNEYKVYLSEDEMEIYKSFKDEYIMELKDKEITASNAATLTNKLVQLSNGAIYNEEHEAIDFHERKLDALEDILEASGPTLVCYWFQHDLERIKERLNRLGVKYECLTSTAAIEAWNRGELPVGIIHPASAGHGLNLQSGGSSLVWYSQIWSLELYQQTIGRLWRQGQKSKTVVVTHIVAAGTVDESILKALISKDKTQSALIEAVKAEVGRV